MGDSPGSIRPRRCSWFRNGPARSDGGDFGICDYGFGRVGDAARDGSICGLAAKSRSKPNKDEQREGGNAVHSQPPRRRRFGDATLGLPNGQPPKGGRHLPPDMGDARDSLL